MPYLRASLLNLGIKKETHLALKVLYPSPTAFISKQ